jgi:putative N-acetylmannosamine-6-phosphate epimerase
MKKALIITGVAVLAVSASAQNWFKGSLDQALAKAKGENKLVLVDFFSAG